MLGEQIGSGEEEVLESIRRQIDQIELRVLFAPLDAAGVREDFRIENVHLIVLVDHIDLLQGRLEHGVLDAAIVVQNHLADVVQVGHISVVQRTGQHQVVLRGRRGAEVSQSVCLVVSCC